jgi:hypothetical protein
MSDPRPPYVVFETRAVEDRDASIAAGHFVAKDVHYAIITPSGSKDRLEKEASVWLVDIEAAVREERFPSDWLRTYKNVYQDFLDGKETPENGISIKNWPSASPAQVSAILGANIRTVEELAEANESALNHIGMGARALKDLAISYLEASQDVGKVSQELNALRKQNEAFTQKNESLQAKVAELASQIEALSKVPA